MVKRTANAVWNGSLKEGKGTVSTERGALKDTPYNFSGRFGEGTTGTNPEELVAAAHAGCFSMAFSGQLGNADITPESVKTTATLTMEPVDGKPTLRTIHLDVTVNAPGADESKVREAADNAKKGCPISRLLEPGLEEITMNLRFEK